MTLGRSAAEAVNDYRHSIQRLVSCVTDSVMDVAGGYYISPIPHTLAMNGGQPTALGGPSRFMLALQQNYRIVESGPSEDTYRVEIAGYNYVVYDSERREVLIYHWHPRGNSSITTPHLHLKQGVQVGLPEVRDAHLPTGYIPLISFLRLLIVDLGAQPRRPDWDTILADVR